LSKQPLPADWSILALTTADYPRCAFDDQRTEDQSNRNEEQRIGCHAVKIGNACARQTSARFRVPARSTLT
jgi:hypothetical protein